MQQQRKLDEALSTFKGQIKVAETLDDKKNLAIGWNCLGDIYKEQGNYDEAVVAFQNSILNEKSLNNKQNLSISWNRLGTVFRDANNLEEAISAFNKAIEIAKEIDDKKNWAISLDCLGILLRDQGKLDAAATAFESEVSIAETTFNNRQIAIAWNNLAGILRQQKYFEKSIFSLLKASTYNEMLKDNQQHRIWNHLGSMLNSRNNLEAANSALQQFSFITESLQFSLHRAVAQHTLGRAYKMMNRFEEAEAILRESQEWLEESNDREMLLKVLKTLSETFEKKKDWQQAEQILRLSYNEAEKAKDKFLQEKIVRKLGEICLEQETEEKLAYAKNYFRHSINLSLEMNDSIRLAQAYKAWGDALRHIGKYEDSVSILVEGFEKLIDNIEDHGQKSGRYITSLNIVTKVLGRTLISLRRREEALKYCDLASLATDSHDTWANLRDEFLSIS